jgi:mannosyltransferase OCH1-like enzyme
MIPKKLHYCWFGQKPLSDLNKRCLDTWTRQFPDFEIKEWNEINSPLESDYCQATIAKRAWSRLSNYVRMYALYAEGGIYFDTDVEVVKSFTPLMTHSFFLGFQQKEKQIDWVNTAVQGGVAGHWFPKLCMDETEARFAKTGEFHRSPTIITKLLEQRGLRQYGLQDIDEVTIYPSEYFYPFPWFGTFSPDCVTENTYCIHHWEATWRNKKQDKVLSYLTKIKKLLRRGARLDVRALVQII